MGKILETSETAKQDYLKTRWYKSNFQMTKKAVIEVLNDMGFEPGVTDDTYGEIFIEGPKFDMTITIFEFSVLETAVDVFYNSKYFLDLGKSKVDILKFYTKLNEKIQFKGFALHPEK